jgi:hypothetical protein
MPRGDLKTVVVLGMHKSATGLVAEGLECAGVCMGGESRGKIHWEDLDFLRMNDRILKRAGGAWNNPPPPEAITRLTKDMRLVDEVRELVEHKRRSAVDSGYSLWGWKEPRTCLTIELYAPFLPQPHYVSIFRPVSNVAEHLYQRYGMPRKEGIALAREYNSRIMRFLVGREGQ